jgi:hypothetical protein
MAGGEPAALSSLVKRVLGGCARIGERRAWTFLTFQLDAPQDLEQIPRSPCCTVLGRGSPSESLSGLK